jgi:Ctr copper transporter family
MSMSSSSSSMTMMGIFTNSHRTPLYSESWTPTSSGAYAGTCIFLVILAIILRGMFAFKSICESRWAAKASNRRFVLVKGQPSEAGKIAADPESTKASLITVNGVEENVKVVRNDRRGVAPFRLSVDVPRAVMTMGIAGVAYLL